MFTAVLFIIAKTLKQPKCPLREEWIKKTWYICKMEYYSDVKKNEMMPLAAMWMDWEIAILSEVSQREKDKYGMISLICKIFKKWYRWTYLKTEIDSLTERMNLWLPEGEG